MGILSGLKGVANSGGNIVSSVSRGEAPALGDVVDTAKSAHEITQGPDMEDITVGAAALGAGALLGEITALLEEE